MTPSPAPLTIAQALAAADLRAVVLKGAALAQAVYGNLALRPMGDLDLLLHVPDVEDNVARRNTYKQDAGLAHVLDHQLIEGAEPALERHPALAAIAAAVDLPEVVVSCGQPGRIAFLFQELNGVP